jgi:subtilisin family serine protease
MKFSRLVVVIGLAVAMTSCTGTKKAIDITHNALINANDYGIVTSANSSLAKKGKMTAEEIKGWPHMDIFKDSVPGMSSAKAYEFVKDKKGTTVIVGIVDSGVDIEHKDLMNVIWTNSGEIANNGIDDDKNGYVDDIHGWNFLGGKKGDAAPEQLEITRIVKKLEKKFDGNDISEADKSEYKYYTELKEKVATKQKEAKGKSDYYANMIKTLKDADKALIKFLGKEKYTLEDLMTIKTDDATINNGLPMISRAFQMGTDANGFAERLQGAVDYFTMQLENHYNLDFNGRITGDDPDNFNERGYGNNIVLGAGPDELHGTHVAGIVGAKGEFNGVAKNVVFMTARAVPDGDEYDKDVALAIRYVVDNGAKVVNMSFGKPYSPHSDWVYEAMKYAAEHDVLLVKAAGNDGHEIDLQENLHFPTDSPNKEIEITNNVITVGASTRHFDENLVASFSNFGKKRVDIFAPGLEIYSTVPHDDYKSIQGTSMASPAVAGVAALVRSYYPQLSANQVKNILIESGIRFDGEVIVPGANGKKMKFENLSRKGSLLNAYNALVLADKIANSK